MEARTRSVHWLFLILIIAVLTGCGGSNGNSSVSGNNNNGITTPTPSTTVAKGYTLMAWNDLGMHCIDGSDYSVFSILPPYNNLHAQLNYDGRVVTRDVTLTYEAVADENGSINTTSIGKTNFWTYVNPLFGVDVAPDTGLTGTKMASTQPEPLTFNTQHNWFEAEGIPITPFDDAGNTNTYPMVKVIAHNSSGQTLATADVVLPVSNEMTCSACHASNSGSTAARPASGWVNDPNEERDWKKNILRLHDQKQAGNVEFNSALSQRGYLASGLEATAASGQPVLCAGCHLSNALPGTGLSGIPSLTQALHTTHADVTNPSTGIKLGSDASRDACYMCHPGSTTQCLRGAMGKAVDASGNPTMSCQSCHGNMAQVGSATRAGWLNEPNCQSCHHQGQRLTTGVDAQGKPIQTSDTRFATNSNTPSSGFSLYRFSTGHGNLQCEACHGSPHAIYPSSQSNDNVLSIGIQGHAGTISECSACHQSNVPFTASGGPHGMHTPGTTWISQHGDIAEHNAQSCTSCHGLDYRGSPLATIKTNQTFTVEQRAITYTAGQEVTCYDCHNGPNGGD